MCYMLVTVVDIFMRRKCWSDVFPRINFWRANDRQFIYHSIVRVKGS